MFLTRFYNEQLAQASYMVGCPASGEALVIDPTRDAEQYIAHAAAEGLRITHVTETHIHADFVSGSVELAERTGAQLYLSDAGNEEWKYAFAEARGAVLLRDGSSFSVGAIRVDVLHTPGHTPEHLSFVVTDTVAANEPMGIFTGDFVFVGDVGRPDLLERAAKQAGTMASSARQLFRSLQRLEHFPDYLQLWPGHGAGSACGKSLGAVPQTTLGYERRFNWAFAPRSEEEFVHMVLAGQPEPPRYFAEMKRVNKCGPRILGDRAPSALAPQRVVDVVDADSAFVLDVRPAAEFAHAHIPGAVNIPLDRSFTTWTGWLVPYDRDLVVIANDEADAADAVRQLAMIGLDRAAGVITAHRAHEAWTSVGRQLETIPQIAPRELAARLAADEVLVLDVRTRTEWDGGHLPGVRNIPLGELPDHTADIPRDRPIAVQCQAGGRSSIAASVLQARGFSDVLNLTGGLAAWEKAGMEVVSSGL
ncbi:MAG TPA: rhodanese-like domain-containing protein [Gemmatimonadaceae bacterium]|nr:rhodanese-like domain-containing protein [Gemmatimonadaceae bacterium]